MKFSWPCTCVKMFRPKSTQDLIKGRAKYVMGRGCRSLLSKTSFSVGKATLTNRTYSNDLEAYGMKYCYFWFYSKIFLTFIVLRWATMALWASCIKFRWGISFILYIFRLADGIKKEDIDTDDTRSFAAVSLDLPATNARFIVESVNHANDMKSFADVIVLDLLESEPTIDVVDDVSSWAQGKGNEYVQHRCRGDVHHSENRVTFEKRLGFNTYNICEFQMGRSQVSGGANISCDNRFKYSTEMDYWPM